MKKTSRSLKRTRLNAVCLHIVVYSRQEYAVSLPSIGNAAICPLMHKTTSKKSCPLQV